MNYTVFFWGIMYLAISRGSVLLWLLIYSMWKHRNVTEISASRIWEGVYKKRAIYIITLMVLVLIGIGLPPLIHSTVNAVRYEKNAGPLGEWFPPEVYGVTDGGTIIYDGGFYEIVKWHQMTGKDDLYYDGIGFSIMGIPLYGDAEVK